ncbi:MAG: pilin [Patescibacteria group bacterium]
MTISTQQKKVSAKILAALAVSFAVCLLWAVPASAQVDLGIEFADSLGLPNGDIREIISRLVNAFLGFIGLILVLMILWSGFKYMTHGGNEENRLEAIAGIKNAVIGLIIMMISYSAADFILDAISEATGIM